MKFAEFIGQLNENIRNDFFYKEILEDGKLWIVLDNATYHKSKDVQDSLNKFGINVLYNLPYLPQFNMIELPFNNLKKVQREELVSFYTHC